MNWSYLIIPALVFVVAAMGSVYTSSGMKWYRRIKTPSWTPPGGVIGFAWTVIFILTAVSGLAFWNDPLWMQDGGMILSRLFIVYLFMLNGFLNVYWCNLFFTQHRFGASVAEAACLALSVYLLIILLYPFTPLAALLLIPYAAWSTFATYLTWRIWHLNLKRRWSFFK